MFRRLIEKFLGVCPNGRVAGVVKSIKQLDHRCLDLLHPLHDHAGPWRIAVFLGLLSSSLVFMVRRLKRATHD